MSDDFLDNLQSLTNNINDIAFTRYVTVTNINPDQTVNCREDNGTEHKNVINTTNLPLNPDDVVLLSFVDNNIYQPMITGGVQVKSADDQMIYALGLGKFQINKDGDLIYTLPIGVENYTSINEDGDLIINLDSTEANKFQINNEGEVIYG